MVANIMQALGVIALLLGEIFCLPALARSRTGHKLQTSRAVLIVIIENSLAIVAVFGVHLTLGYYVVHVASVHHVAMIP